MKNLDNSIEKRRDKFSVNKAILTTQNTETHTDLVSFYGWLKESNSIISGFGTLFKRHDQYDSIIVKMIKYLMEERTVVKKQMFSVLDSNKGNTKDPLYKSLDQSQKIYKLLANSFYGAYGEKRFHCYDKKAAPAITYTDQIITTTILLSFESFLGNNPAIESEDELLKHIFHCYKETGGVNPSEELGDCPFDFFKDKSIIDYLKEQCVFKWSQEFEEKVDSLIRTEEDKFSLLFRGKPYMFFDSFPYVHELYISCHEDKDNINKLWNCLKKWVIFPWLHHNATNRVNRLKRKVAILSDTDSTFINLEPWVNYGWERLGEGEMEQEDLLCLIDVATKLLKLYTEERLERICYALQIPEDHHWLIEFKNEFLISRMLLTEGKKHYMYINLAQEGKLINEGKGELEIKGLAMKKSNTSKQTGEYLQNLCESRIMRGDVDRVGLLKDIVLFEDEIKSSFSRGEVSYSSPSTMKRDVDYQNKWRIQSIRGKEAWNAIMPHASISAGEKVNLLHIRVGKDFDLLKEHCKDTEILQRLYNIFWSVDSEEDAKKRGFNWLAVPKTHQIIPEWLRPLLNLENSVAINIAPIHPIFKTLGLRLVNTKSGNVDYTNLVEL